MVRPPPTRSMVGIAAATAVGLSLDALCALLATDKPDQRLTA